MDGKRVRDELIAELAQPDMVDEANQAFGGPPGRDGLIAHAKGFRRHIGALKVTIDQIVAGNDEVMAQWSFTGSHIGPWMGQFFEDLETAESADLYVPIGMLGRRFLEVESLAFQMLD